MSEPERVLEVEGLVAGYVPEVNILDGLHARVDHGEIVTVVGPNGAGKSTLIRAVIGLLRPSSGTIHLRGRDITGLKPHQVVAAGVAYVAQRDNVFPRMSVQENLQLGAIPLESEDVDARIAEMYEAFPALASRRKQAAGTLSGGERQMVALARALVPRPAVMLLDEPSAGLSPMMVDTIFAKIQEINATGVSILMVEQNARRALEMSHRGYVLDGGRNRYEGSGPELVSDPKVVDLYLGGRGRIDGENVTPTGG